jgi:hypothetical protein
MVSTQRPAAHRFLVVFLLLLCGGALATSPERYYAVSVDSIISSKARVNCYHPDTRIPGNKLRTTRECEITMHPGRGVPLKTRYYY